MRSLVQSPAPSPPTGSMVAHTCDPSTREPEQEDYTSLGQPVLRSEVLFRKQNETKTKLKKKSETKTHGTVRVPFLN